MIFSSIFLIQIIITLVFAVLAAILDIKSNVVPNWLTYTLMIFGVISNGILSLLSHNVKFILASFISMAVTYSITYMLWQLDMWGGGDVKLFTGIASVIPMGLNIDFLNIFPQQSIYPFSFSVVVNSILVSFPFLLIFVIYLIVKSDLFNSNTDLLMNMFNLDSLKYIKNTILNRDVSVKDLKEGMIINAYYYDDEWISTLIKEIDGNLNVYRCEDGDEFKYYFKSQSAGGITYEEVYLLKIMEAQGFIKDNLRRKLAFPFTPAIFAGLLIAVFFGDIMMLFTKNVVLVI